MRGSSNDLKLARVCGRTAGRLQMMPRIIAALCALALLCLGATTEARNPVFEPACDVYTASSESPPSAVAEALRLSGAEEIRVCLRDWDNKLFAFAFFTPERLHPSVCGYAKRQLFQTPEGKWSIADPVLGAPAPGQFMLIERGTCPARSGGNYIPVQGALPGLFVQLDRHAREICDGRLDLAQAIRRTRGNDPIYQVEMEASEALKRSASSSCLAELRLNRLNRSSVGPPITYSLMLVAADQSWWRVDVDFIDSDFAVFSARRVVH